MFSDNIVLAVGNFDGVHKGHQKIIESTKKLAKEIGLENNCGVVFFSPHPKLFFNQELQFLITSEEQKVSIFASYGIENVFILNFAEVCELTPEDFCNSVLLEKFKVKGLVTGSNFRFGKNRSADTNFLESFAAANSIKYLKVAEEANNNGIVYSSSQIRRMIERGEVNLVKNFMGRNFVVLQQVIHGRKLGRELGFPTANLSISNYVQPKYGVYVVNIELDNKHYQGVASFGLRPTVNSAIKKPILEVHIFDFNDNIYDKYLKVEFLFFIREEIKFSGIEELKLHISADIKEAKNYLRIV